MRVIVTGGAGFIGSWTAEVLVDNGHEVFVVGDLSTGVTCGTSSQSTRYSIGEARRRYPPSGCSER